MINDRSERSLEAPTSIHPRHCPSWRICCCNISSRGVGNLSDILTCKYGLRKLLKGLIGSNDEQVEKCNEMKG
jgi:hypothetical protein